MMNDFKHFIESRQTESPDFKSWFSGSKIVDASGNPLIVYHGSSVNIRRFSLKLSTYNTIWFTSDKEKIINGESGAASNKVIIPVYLKITKPAGWEEYNKLLLFQLKQEFDGIILDDDYVVFHPNQIRKVRN